MTQEATRGKRPSPAQALAQALSKVLVVAAGRGGDAAATPAPAAEEAPHGAVTRAVPRTGACDRTAAIDAALSGVAAANTEWSEDKAVLTGQYNLPGGLVEWIGFGYRLGHLRGREPR